MKTLTFKVTLDFDGRVDTDELFDIRENVLSALINQINNDGLTPELSTASTSKIMVQDELTNEISQYKF